MPQEKIAVQFDEKKIDAIFADLDSSHSPGAAVGIAIRGRPVYRKGFGVASVRLPIALSTSTRMRVQSVTKHFTAFAYLLLCEQGKAGIDDPIKKYLPELHPVAHNVTMRQLMGHTGGLREAQDIRYTFSGNLQEVPSAEVVALYRDIDDVDFVPGASWRYNNGGYHILTAVIERISGERFEDVLRTSIFEPLGMYDTQLHRLENRFLPNTATNHVPTSDDAFERSPALGEMAGNGGMISTVDDMLRWLAHMDKPVIGSADTWRLMKTPQRLPDGTVVEYSMGLLTEQYRGARILAHAGGTIGSNSYMVKVPSADLNVQIMVNRHDVNSVLLANKILDACLPDLDPIEAIQRPGHTRSGVFQSKKTGRVVQLLSQDGQQIALIDNLDIPVAPDRDGVLRPTGLYSSLLLAVTLPDRSERPQSLRLDDFGTVDELTVVEPADGSNVSPILGFYSWAATGTSARIYDSDTGAWLQTTGRFGSTRYKLECLARGIWRARSMQPATPWQGGILGFVEGHRKFYFSTYRNRQLLFQRRQAEI